MTTRLLAPLVWCLLALPVGCAGPQMAPVLVRDAETHAPIPGAEVHLSSPRAGTPAAGVTGPDGLARVAVAAPGESAVLAQVSAVGYLPRDTDLTGRVARGPGDPTVVELFAGPRPAVELVLPDGFQGVVRARLRVREDAPVGGRTFVVTVPKSGTVEVSGPPVLTQPPGPVFTARYESGARLEADPGEAAVGLRWVWTEGPEEVFVVGTRADQTAAAKSLGYAPVTGSRSGGGGPPGGGGGGRGGGRGGHRGGR